VYVPNKGGVTTSLNGDIYSTQLSGQQTGGQIGLVEATVPPCGNVHRFYDPGIQLAKLGFIYTPGGAEGHVRGGR
jgi:hypothetical protein